MQTSIEVVGARSRLGLIMMIPKKSLMEKKENEKPWLLPPNIPWHTPVSFKMTEESARPQ